MEEWNEETGDHDLKAGYDPGVRDAILDREGVVAEVLFPDADVLGTGRLAASPFGSGLGSGSGVDPANVRAGARAHNRWLADFCATDPHRRIGVAVVPITAGVDEAVAEIHAAVAGGLRGIMIPTRWFDAPAYIDLRYSIAENGAWWVPDIVQRMNEKWDGGHNTRKFGDAFRLDLPMRPGDYVDRNCFFAASTPGADEIDRRHAIGVDNLLWGNDLPHPEGTYPHTRKWIAERFRDVPEDETAKILGETAAALYRVDVAAVADIVDRIGPSRADVHA